MIRINVISEEKSWSKKLKKKESLFNNICKHFPKKFRFLNKKVYLTLLLSNNKNIKILNKKFRKKNKHTDILSFPSGQKTKNLKKIYLGDIIISYNYMNKPKDLTNFEFKKKTIKIFIHGYLHLLGYDHINLKDYQIMYREEKKIFDSIEKLLN
jgi:probable rRNA maturation factor